MAYPAPMGAAQGSRSVFVERGLALRGALAGCDHLTIAGHVESDVAVRSIEIREQGSFKGSANAGEARIAGHYEGALIVAETLVVSRSARIRGAVQCGRLQLEEGGTIEGELRVLDAEAADAQAADDAAALEPLLLAAAPSTEADVDDDIGDAGPSPIEALEAILVSAAAVGESVLLAEAAASFRSALAADIHDAAALSGLGHLARQSGDLAGALAYFKLVMAADTENVSVRYVSIKILRALSRRREAATVVGGVRAIRSRRALPAAPQGTADRGPPDDRSVSLAFEEAEAMFKSVLDRHPRNLGALAGLGHLARRRGDRAAMRQYYGAALAAEPTNITLRIEIARAFKEQGDIAQARQILETVLNEDTGFQARRLAAS
jgi:cytoskeletal protein CcmA (bactofilin family)/Tfp pilus assembly protein PilF